MENINLIIILTKELRKQKKIHIVYNHILNKVLNELNYLNEEKKYFKNKISVLQKINQKNKEKHKMENA
ncbi:hypothetical protein PFTANZ_03473 [Plasmodium falciparum Tanzania (2000708)]|uniref:Uncharacterized protein n=2 Tax=Plasmodium falciparum TaxID=5833 RepID=A0A024W5V7_PLAFA|nr:hypothetical protein PFTANZ_03473 [Plasmodium falciparum Tanzania (2000708)]ETW60715.1 hypothetical protein PFMC_03415 [Plasmodium falciparum CAMP/Malaysia]